MLEASCHHRAECWAAVHQDVRLPGVTLSSVNQFVKLLWSKYKIPICVVATILAIVYLANLSDASLNPWTLWRREWVDTTEGVLSIDWDHLKQKKRALRNSGED